MRENPGKSEHACPPSIYADAPLRMKDPPPQSFLCPTSTRLLSVLIYIHVQKKAILGSCRQKVGALFALVRRSWFGNLIVKITRDKRLQMFLRERLQGQVALTWMQYSACTRQPTFSIKILRSHKAFVTNVLRPSDTPADYPLLTIPCRVSISKSGGRIP